MNACLETIRVQNRQLCNIHYHNERLNRTRRELFSCADQVYLENVINIPSELNNDIYKCRVIYDTNITKVEFQAYQIKPIHSIHLVTDNDFDYHYKWLDRSRFAAHLAKTQSDDILIVKNGFLTDTSYANIALFDGVKWRTPATPLLPGTRRQSLLDAGEIIAEALLPKDLRHFQYAKLLNAMLDWEESPLLKVNTIKINN